MRQHASGEQVIDTLQAIGCMPFISSFRVGLTTVSGRCNMRLIVHLRKDKRFAETPWHLLHDVGPSPMEFRSYRGKVVKNGSMQVVIGQETGEFEADIDLFNTQDVFNTLGHLFVEVLPNWLRPRRQTDVA